MCFFLCLSLFQILFSFVFFIQSFLLSRFSFGFLFVSSIFPLLNQLISICQLGKRGDNPIGNWCLCSIEHIPWESTVLQKLLKDKHEFFYFSLLIIVPNSNFSNYNWIRQLHLWDKREKKTNELLLNLARIVGDCDQQSDWFNK